MEFHPPSQLYKLDIPAGRMGDSCPGFCRPWLLAFFTGLTRLFFILLIAIMLGTVIRPGCDLVESARHPQRLGIILVFILLLACSSVSCYCYFPLIFAQGTTIAAALPGYYQSLREGMVNYPNQWIVRLSGFLPAALPAPVAGTANGQQTLASAGNAWGYVDIGGQGHFCGHSSATVGLSLDTRWATHDSFNVAAGFNRPA